MGNIDIQFVYVNPFRMTKALEKISLLFCALKKKKEERLG